MDPGQAERIADALLEPERRRQARARQSRLLRRWTTREMAYRNRRALRLAAVVTVAAAVVAGMVGAMSVEALATLDAWRRLAAVAGGPAWLFGLWWFRMPPRPVHIEEL